VLSLGRAKGGEAGAADDILTLDEPVEAWKPDDFGEVLTLDSPPSKQAGRQPGASLLPHNAPRHGVVSVVADDGNGLPAESPGKRDEREVLEISGELVGLQDAGHSRWDEPGEDMLILGQEEPLARMVSDAAGRAPAAAAEEELSALHGPDLEHRDSLRPAGLGVFDDDLSGSGEDDEDVKLLKQELAEERIVRRELSATLRDRAPPPAP